jgi:hypothetical protein
LQRYTKTLFDKILINVFKCDFQKKIKKKPQKWLLKNYAACFSFFLFI